MTCVSFSDASGHIKSYADGADTIEVNGDTFTVKDFVENYA